MLKTKELAFIWVLSMRLQDRFPKLSLFGREFVYRTLERNYVWIES